MVTDCDDAIAASAQTNGKTNGKTNVKAAQSGFAAPGVS